MIPMSWWIVYDCSTLRTEQATTLTTTRCCRSSNFAKPVLLKIKSRIHKMNQSNDTSKKKYIIFLYSVYYTSNPEKEI